MGLIISGSWLVYILLACGIAFLLFGFYLIRPIATIAGFFIGYFIAINLLPLQAELLEAVSIFIGIVAAGVFFSAYLVFPFLLGSLVVYFASNVALAYYAFPAEPYHYILFAVLSLIIGLSVFVAKDYFSVIWTVLFGAVVTTLSAGYLYLIPSSTFIINHTTDFINRSLDLLNMNAFLTFIVLTALVLIGLIVQLFFTSNAQLFIRRRYIGKHRSA